MYNNRPLLNKKSLFKSMNNEGNGNDTSGNSKNKKNRLFGSVTNKPDRAEIIANNLLERSKHGGHDKNKNPIQPPSVLSEWVLRMAEEVLSKNPDIILTNEVNLEDYKELGAVLAGIAHAIMTGAVVTKIEIDKKLKNG